MANYPWNCSWWLFQILMFDILALEDIYICHTFTWTAPVENKGLHGLGQGRACKTLGFRFKEKQRNLKFSMVCCLPETKRVGGCFEMAVWQQTLRHVFIHLWIWWLLKCNTCKMSPRRAVCLPLTQNCRTSYGCIRLAFSGCPQKRSSPWALQAFLRGMEASTLCILDWEAKPMVCPASSVAERAHAANTT